jgi:hypothetical protein
MKGIRVKIAWDGALYVEGGRLSNAGLQPFFDEARSQDAVLVCYREGVGRAASAEQVATIKMLQAAGLELIDPVDAPSEWGPLQSFELELTPDRFRMAAQRGEDLLFAYKPEGADQPLVYRFKGVADAALQNLELLVSANRIVESKPHEADRAFCEETLAKRGLHLRFSFGPRKMWQGYFEEAELPGHFENLYLGCRSLGLHVVKASLDEHDQPLPPQPPPEGRA